MKWAGNIGFFIESEVFKDGVGTGVWKSEIVERRYTGDLIRDFRTQDPGNGQVNDNFNISNSISIVADRFIDEHIVDMKYIEFKGAKWKIKSFTQNHPRLEISLGGLYHEEQT